MNTSDYLGDKQCPWVNKYIIHTNTRNEQLVAIEVEVIDENDWTVNCDQYVGVGLAVLKPDYPGEMEALIDGLTIAFHVRQGEVKAKTRH
jgi:hypothetical protein